MKRNRKRSIFLPTVMILLSVMIIAVIPTEAEGALYEDTVRLHILANSDSEKDQAIKLKLRDAILTEFSAELKSFETKNEAEIHLSEILPRIEEFANEELKRIGTTDTAKCELKEEWYDTREYEKFTLPRGYYTSLVIRIGKAEGKNWWCVMFPPLCMDIATENAPKDDGIKKYSDSEFTLITNKGYNAKFKILELVSDIFASN